uniref:Zgc:153909 n=1 Tax=Danio rerio TaxID=7955 RepID=Q08BD9_DANRE|nr:chromatin target of PRMT1b [Danio rerio]AAI24770.1 Zgc:153909 [Danio rerio]|eukprot:NP_001070774.1 chromatin target of PRMT1b [Danio rerio]
MDVKMNPMETQKIILNSTCTVSLHDRFTSLLKHQAADVMAIAAAGNQQTAASLKNQRLALEMANRPSVLAALHNTAHINNQLCKVNMNVKARLGHPVGRGGMMGLHGQMRGGGRSRRGMVKGFCTKKSVNRLPGKVNTVGVAVQRGWSQQQPGSNMNWAGPMGPRGGGAIKRTEGNVVRQVLHPGAAQAINSRPVCAGRGHFTPISKKAYSGYSRVRFDSPQVPATREQLDEQLDEYMSKSKSHLDAELDAYMAQVDLKHIV